MARHSAGPSRRRQLVGLAIGALLLTLGVAGYGLTADEAPPEKSAAAGTEACAAPPAAPSLEVVDGVLASGGVDRTYRVTLPASYDPTVPTPTIVLFHGTGGSPDDIEGYTGLTGPAGERGYVVVTPQGLQLQTEQGELPAAWDVPGFRTGVDDVAFIEALLADLGTRYCLDRDRVYGTGISAGGAFPAYLACESNVLAAIAPVAGANLVAPCTSGRPIGFLGFHGTADLYVSYAGIGPDGNPIDPGATPGPTPSAGGVDGFYNGPALVTAQSWAERAGCSDPTDEPVAGDVTRRVFACPDGVIVNQYTVVDGGHTWPGADPAVRSECCGTTTESIDANLLMLDFFDQQARVGG